MIHDSCISNRTGMNSTKHGYREICDFASFDRNHVKAHVVELQARKRLGGAKHPQVMQGKLDALQTAAAAAAAATEAIRYMSERPFVTCQKGHSLHVRKAIRYMSQRPFVTCHVLKPRSIPCASLMTLRFGVTTSKRQSGGIIHVQKFTLLIPKHKTTHTQPRHALWRNMGHV
jgi:hypothetical protein